MVTRPEGEEWEVQPVMKNGLTPTICPKCKRGSYSGHAKTCPWQLYREAMPFCVTCLWYVRKGKTAKQGFCTAGITLKFRAEGCRYGWKDTKGCEGHTSLDKESRDKAKRAMQCHK